MSEQQWKSDPLADECANAEKMARKHLTQKGKSRTCTGVFIRWTGMDHWTTGMDYWNTGMDYWNTGMDYWNGYLSHKMLVKGKGRAWTIRNLVFQLLSPRFIRLHLRSCNRIKQGPGNEASSVPLYS